jgi:hypothetical protein
MNTGIFTFVLATIHLFAGQLKFLKHKPRSRGFSFGSGVSVAYVFIHILPELSQAQEKLQNGVNISFLEHHVYLVALGGLTVFYGLERFAMITRPTSSRSRNSEVTTAGFFWVHIAFFAIYNFLIGYLLVHREDRGIKNLLLFVVAMALHFVINDHGLRQHHRQIYDDIGRWLLAIAIICGWLTGIVTKIEQVGIAVLFAFLAGGIVLNVLKEELPPERESCFWSFAVGTLSYTILLLAT